MAGKFNTLRTVCVDAVRQGVLPGLVVHVRAAQETLFHEAFGDRQRDGRTFLPATTQTVYDLASLTKALVTSVLVMRAVGDGLLGLDDRLADHNPAWLGPGKAEVTLRQLLCHASGLPAHRPFHQQAGDRVGVVALAAREPLVSAPAAKSLYSDLGFILLGDVLERRLGARLDVLAERFVVGPLGLGSLCFVDLGAPSPLTKRDVAATEACPVRGRVIVGQVHDLNASAMGGVAGHAGLFGCAADVASLAAALGAAWRGETDNIVSPAVIRAFWSPAGIPGSTWRLGWDGPAVANSAAGDLLDRRSVGHLGFTGCSLWIDPVRDTSVVVLSNRIHPSAADNPGFRALRRVLNDAALEGAGYRP